MIVKTQEEKIIECVDIRKQIQHTDMLRYKDNENKIKKAMDDFIKLNIGSTLRLWCNDKQKTRAILILSINKNHKSGITMEYL